MSHSDGCIGEWFKNSAGIERPSIAATIPKSSTSTGVLTGMAEKSAEPVPPPSCSPCAVA
ncbi:hypothetical protein K0M31_010009 [Melipona bicolor]|uniref:Uncharacterized protein n=1 Tax=Melipona bicolor TaxID=60889 RepID=A0AA40FML9_9HYME|nr:hypothetical protein K0M31_010009 [Melipona bicolor]